MEKNFQQLWSNPVISFVFMSKWAMSANRFGFGFISRTAMIMTVFVYEWSIGNKCFLYIQVKVMVWLLYSITTNWLLSESLKTSNKNVAVHRCWSSWHWSNFSLKPRLIWIFCVKALNFSLSSTNVTLQVFFKTKSIKRTFK